MKKRSLALKFIYVLLAINAGLQCWYLEDLARHLVKLQREQKQDLAKWDEWERVGKAKVAAGSKTTFVPDPFRLKGIRRGIVGTHRLIVLAVLVIAVSISSVVGLFKRWKWAYWLALVYTSIAVAYGIFEVAIPAPTVPRMYIYAKLWGSLTFILAKGLVFHGLMLWCLLRPAVKTQFVSKE